MSDTVKDYKKSDQCAAASLLNALISWVNKDHEDTLTISHNQGCYIRDEIERLRKAEQENVALRAKMQQIDDWCEAYPLDVFTEPDMAEVRKLLGDTLLTQLSAHNFRHVLNGVKQIAARGREGESEVQP